MQYIKSFYIKKIFIPIFFQICRLFLDRREFQSIKHEKQLIQLRDIQPMGIVLPMIPQHLQLQPFENSSCKISNWSNPTNQKFKKMFHTRIRSHLQKRLVKLIFDFPEVPLETRLSRVPTKRGDFDPFKMYFFRRF